MLNLEISCTHKYASNSSLGFIQNKLFRLEVLSNKKFHKFKTLTEPPLPSPHPTMVQSN